MKYLIKFNESYNIDIEVIEDYLLEYFDKYKLSEVDKYYNLEGSNQWMRSQYKGMYSIRKVSTNFFGVKGFPNGKNGFLIKITFFLRPKKDIEDMFKKDIESFINRFSKNEDFKCETSHDDVLNNGTIIEYYIAFFK